MLRPLVSYDRSGDRSDLLALWPLLRDTREGRSFQRWIFPLWFHGRWDHDGVLDDDGFLLPFFFYGADDEEGRY
ncbi:MAG: hypothetical protein KDC38_02240, partial [Planctomycetes bacterium]|nr:hypothetical protein [Planctomycetota bacterium]